MIRRISAFLLVAVLVLFGPAPMSLCAAMADLPADCIPTPHCETMGSEPADSMLAAQAEDCCVVGSAPVPERQVNAPAPAVSLQPAPAPQPVAPVVEAETAEVAPSARSAPTDLQSTLCVFLI